MKNANRSSVPAVASAVCWIEDHDRERDHAEDQEVPREGTDVSHAVMYARTPRAAATSVAPLNQASRARRSAGA